MKTRKRRPKQRKRGKTKPKTAPAETTAEEAVFENKHEPDPVIKPPKIHKPFKQPRQVKSG